MARRAGRRGRPRRRMHAARPGRGSRRAHRHLQRRRRPRDRALRAGGRRAGRVHHEDRAHRGLPGHGHDARSRTGSSCRPTREAVLRTTSLLGEKFVELRPTGGRHAGAGADPRWTADIITRTRQAPELEFVAEEAVRCWPGWRPTTSPRSCRPAAVGLRRPGRRAGPADRRPVDRERHAGRPDRRHRGHHRRARQGHLHPRRRRRPDRRAAREPVAHHRRCWRTTASSPCRRCGTSPGSPRPRTSSVFAPYRDDIERQVRAARRHPRRWWPSGGRRSACSSTGWPQFVHKTPLGVPGDFAQIYGWFAVGPVGGGTVKRRVVDQPRVLQRGVPRDAPVGHQQHRHARRGREAVHDHR